MDANYYSNKWHLKIQNYVERTKFLFNNDSVFKIVIYNFKVPKCST